MLQVTEVKHLGPGDRLFGTTEMLRLRLQNDTIFASRRVSAEGAQT
jgi:hypothetical protein